MIAGLDVGRFHDRSALVRLDGRRIVDVRVGLGPLLDQQKALIPLLRPCALIACDAGGLGRGLAEGLAATGLPVMLVTIVAGHTLRETPSGEVHAGKPWLVSRLRAAVAEHEISCPSSAIGAEILRSEMAAFMATVRRSGAVAYEASAGKHDDAVIALALALLGSDASVKAAQIPRANGHAA